MTNLSELWKISKTVYREIFFQANVSFRTAGMLPQSQEDVKKNIENIIKSIKFSGNLSKGTMVFLILFLVGITFSSNALSQLD
ncbi:MAG: hypothetical protein NZ873_03050, partial [Crenarchaeota archaeon]|nr:hypothetical protein [Thermoproteota archaeon]MDW8034698.1 hypothetical protein [Nitrososphaerota archaeon]